MTSINQFRKQEEEVLTNLVQIFPNVDRNYLVQSMQTQLSWSSSSNSTVFTTSSSTSTSSSKSKGKGKALNQDVIQDSNTLDIERLISKITTKMLELNKGYYPTTTWNESASVTTKLKGKKVEDLKFIVADLERKKDNAKTMDKNLAMIHLHQIFPNTPISILRNTLSSLSHSYLYDAVEKLLSNSTQSPLSPKAPTTTTTNFFSSFFTRTTIPIPIQQVNPVLLPSDLFRSEEYTQSLINHLKFTFPLVPLFTIKSLVSDGGTYSEIRTAVESWRSKSSRLKVWLSDVFLNSSSTTNNSTNSSKKGILSDETELGKEIWEFEAPIREAKVKEDEKLARELNLEFSKLETKYDCGCCFDTEVNFVDVGFCSSGLHSFCKECISKQVEEHVYGQAPLRILVEKEVEGSNEGEGTGVRCLSTEGCLHPFSLSTLERILNPTLYSALSRRLSEAALESLESIQLKSTSNDETIIRCPFCPYSEIGDGAVLKKAFPFITAFRKGKLNLRTLIFYPWLDLFSTINFIHLYGLAYIIVSCFPDSFSYLAGISSNHKANKSNQVPLIDDNPTFFPLLEPSRVILVSHRFFTSIGKKILNSRNGNRNTFQCKNGPNSLPLKSFGEGFNSEQEESIKDYNDLITKVWPNYNSTSTTTTTETCGKLSCITCERIYIDGRHVCYEDEKEGLRLAVEKAIDSTFKRTCPNCSISFLKSDGCNKMVCRCGYQSCYLCRKDIKEEGYNHFCPHFRSILGASCSECTRCYLWETADDNKAIEEAKTRARDEWVREHPLTSKNALNQRIGHSLVKTRVRDQFALYVEYFLRLLL